MANGKLGMTVPGLGLEAIKFHGARNGNWWEHLTMGSTTRTDTALINAWLLKVSGQGQVAGTTGGHIWPGYGLGVGPGAGPATNNSTTLPCKITATETGTIKIIGVNNLGVIAWEDIAVISGTVTTVQHYFRIIDARCISGFSTTRNSAVITLYGNNGTSVMGYIPAGTGRLSCSSMQVPAGYTAHLIDARVSKSGAAAFAGIFAIAEGVVDAEGGSVNNMLLSTCRDGVFFGKLSFTEKNMIIMAGDATTTGVDFCFDMDILLIKD